MATTKPSNNNSVRHESKIKVVRYEPDVIHEKIGGGITRVTKRKSQNKN